MKTNLRNFVLETYEVLKSEIEDNKWVDAFIKDAKRDSRGNCLVLAEGIKLEGTKTLLIYTEWDELSSWENLLKQSVL